MSEFSDAHHEWVGDTVLDALGVDRWDKHVDEMLNYDSRPIPGPMATNAIFTSDQVKMKNLIRRELAARMDDKINEIVDAAIAARIPALSQPNSTNTKANTIANNIKRKILHDLDHLQRLELDERSLNFKLVDRLFQIPAGGLGQPGSRFASSIRGLQHGDKVTSVLVSFIEALVVKVDMLQTKVDAMDALITCLCLNNIKIPQQEKNKDTLNLKQAMSTRPDDHKPWIGDALLDTRGPEPVPLQAAPGKIAPADPEKISNTESTQISSADDKALIDFLNRETADRLAEEAAAVITQEINALITQETTAIVAEEIIPPMADKTAGRTAQKAGAHIAREVSEAIDEVTTASLEASNAEPIKSEDGKKKKRKKRGKKKKKTQQGVDSSESQSVDSNAWTDWYF